MSSDRPPPPAAGEEPPGSPAAGGVPAPSFSPDSMNTFVDRHRDGSWCVWTTVDGGARVVSRHASRASAEQAQRTVRGDARRDDRT